MNCAWLGIACPHDATPGLINLDQTRIIKVLSIAAVLNSSRRGDGDGT